MQGPRRVFKSGPAEEAIKWRRHKRGGEPERGSIPPLWGLRREFFCILSASVCIFNGGFMRFGPDFSGFGYDLLLEKIFHVA